MKYESYVSDLHGNSYICPNCHSGTFYDCNNVDHRGWHKCTHCGYMCLSADHMAKIKKALDEYYKIPSDTESQQKDKEK